MPALIKPYTSSYLLSNSILALPHTLFTTLGYESDDTPRVVNSILRGCHYFQAYLSVHKGERKEYWLDFQLMSRKNIAWLIIL